MEFIQEFAELVILSEYEFKTLELMITDIPECKLTSSLITVNNNIYTKFVITSPSTELLNRACVQYALFWQLRPI